VKGTIDEQAEKDVHSWRAAVLPLCHSWTSCLKYKYDMQCVFGVVDYRLNVLLCRMYKYRFVGDMCDIDSVLSDMDLKLLNNTHNRTTNSLLPSIKSSVCALGDREHHFELPTRQSSLFRNSFVVVQCLYTINIIAGWYNYYLWFQLFIVFLV